MLLRRNAAAFDTYHSGLLSQLACNASNNGLFNISYIILVIFQSNVVDIFFISINGFTFSTA